MQTLTKHASASIFISNDRKHFSSQSVWEINGCHQINYTAEAEPKNQDTYFAMYVLLCPCTYTVTCQ